MIRGVFWRCNKRNYIKTLLSVLFLFGYNTGNCTVQQPDVQNGGAIVGVKQDAANTQQPAQSNGLLPTIDQMVISTPTPNGNLIDKSSEAQKVIDRIYISLSTKINTINTQINKTFNINHFKQYNDQLIQTLVSFVTLLKDNQTINETPEDRYKALKEAAISICEQYLNQCDNLLKNTNAITWFKYNKRNLYSLQSTISGLQFALGKLPQEKNGLTQLNSQYWLELSEVLE